MNTVIAWVSERWFVEAVIIILLSFIVGLVIGKVMSCLNGDN